MLGYLNLFLCSKGYPPYQLGALDAAYNIQTAEDDGRCVGNLSHRGIPRLNGGEDGKRGGQLPWR